MKLLFIVLQLYTLLRYLLAVYQSLAKIKMINQAITHSTFLSFLALFFDSHHDSLESLLSRRCPRQRLHQRQLRRWLPPPECLHRHPGLAPRNFWGFLENGLGATHGQYYHDDQTGREVTGKTKARGWDGKNRAAEGNVVWVERNMIGWNIWMLIT